MKYTEKIKVYRLTTISWTNSEPTLYIDNIEWNIQTWADWSFSSIEEDWNLFKMYMIYIDWIYDIKNNDLIESSSWDIYKVRWVSKYDTDFTKNTQIEALLPIQLW